MMQQQQPQVNFLLNVSQLELLERSTYCFGLECTNFEEQ